MGILYALGGRYVWRWWMPLLVWGFHATVSRFRARANPAIFPLQTGAYETFTLVTLVSLLAIWIWGSRLAVAFGHRRSHVFILTSITTTGMFVGSQLLAEVANRIEHALVGQGAIRVMAMNVPAMANPEPVSQPLFSDLIAWTMTDLTYLLPATVSIVVVACWGMRWGWRGVLPGLLLVSVAFLTHLMLSPALESHLARGPRQRLLVDGLALWLTVTALLALAWLAFRRVPV